MCFFSFWFWDFNVGFDSANSLSLPICFLCELFVSFFKCFVHGRLLNHFNNLLTFNYRFLVYIILIYDRQVLYMMYDILMYRIYVLLKLLTNLEYVQTRNAKGV